MTFCCLEVSEKKAYKLDQKSSFIWFPGGWIWWIHDTAKCWWSSSSRVPVPTQDKVPFRVHDDNLVWFPRCYWTPTTKRLGMEGTT